MPLRLVLVVALCTLLGLPVVAAMAASPDPSGAAVPAHPAGTGDPGKGGFGHGWGFGAGPGKGGSGFGQGDLGGFGRGDVTIVSIDGSKLDLTTEDGWTRTITVTSATKITKNGDTIAVGDLAAGDAIGFRQTKNADGTYTITDITVRTPKAGGEVTAVTSDSITVTARGGTKTTITVDSGTKYFFGKDAGTKADVTVGSRIAADGTKSGDTFTAARIVIQPAISGGEVTAKTGTTITVKGLGGKAATIHVDGDTTYKVRGKDAATLADIAVGDYLIASGKARTDGSLDASQVGAGKFDLGKFGRGDHQKPQKPAASATP